MSWIEIAESDLLTRINSAELEGIRAAALAVGQADPVAPSIIQVVNRIRGSVAACDSNTLGDGDTIPDELLGAALDMLVYIIPSRVGADASDTRKDLHDKAVALLKEVALCRFYIQDPVTASTTDPPKSVPAITARDREFTRAKQDGI